MPRRWIVQQRFIHPCTGKMAISRGSTGSLHENVRVKIPVMAQTMPEMTYTDVAISPLLVIRAISIKIAAAPIRRIAAVVYLFRCSRFTFLPLFPFILKSSPQEDY
jgi:hypothetical protein